MFNGENIASKEKWNFLITNNKCGKNAESNQKLVIVVFIFICMLVSTTFGLIVLNALKVQILTTEVNILKAELEELKITILKNQNLFDKFPLSVSNLKKDNPIDKDEEVSNETFSIVKREIYGNRETTREVEGFTLNSDNNNYLQTMHGQSDEGNTKMTRNRNNAWVTADDVEIIDPKTSPPTRKKNKNKHNKNNLESLESAIVHFSGDTSKYIFGKHENFKGNGHLRHPDRTFADWKESDWMRPLGMNEKFDLVNGFLKIKQTGLYFIYAQIYYLDEHDTNGYHVHKNRDPILQCTVMTHSMSPVTKGNTCFTAGIEHLREGDEISVKDVATHRYSLFEPGKSFFGAFKLGDVKVK